MLGAAAVSYLTRFGGVRGSRPSNDVDGSDPDLDSESDSVSDDDDAGDDAAADEQIDSRRDGTVVDCSSDDDAGCVC
jgi:hypothetical protein